MTNTTSLIALSSLLKSWKICRLRRIKFVKMLTWKNWAENLQIFLSENPRITNGAKIRQTGIRKVQSSSSAQRETLPPTTSHMMRMGTMLFLGNDVNLSGVSTGRNVKNRFYLCELYWGSARNIVSIYVSRLYDKNKLKQQHVGPERDYQLFASKVKNKNFPYLPARFYKLLHFLLSFVFSFFAIL